MADIDYIRMRLKPWRKGDMPVRYYISDPEELLRDALAEEAKDFTRNKF